MSAYFLLILSLLFIFLVDSFLPVKTKHLEIFAVILVTLFSGLREYVGYDFYNYWEIYAYGNADESSEPGFLLIMNVLRWLGQDYHVFFFVFSLITYYFIYKAIATYTDHSKLGFLVYMLVPGLYLNSLSVVRQAVALGIGFYAFQFLMNGQMRKYLFFMFLATMFHYTCMLVIPFHFLCRQLAPRLSAKHYIMILVGSLVFGQLNISILLFSVLKNFERYQIYSDVMPMNLSKLLVLNAFCIGLLLFYNTLRDNKEENSYFMFFTVFAVVVTNIAYSFEWATRFSYYFKVFEVIIIAETIYLFGFKTRLLVAPVVLSYYLFIFYAALANDLSLDSDGPKLTPYKSIFTTQEIND